MSSRPFRIWNVRTSKYERGRNYRYEDHARLAALGLAYFGKPRDAFEVLDVTRGNKSIAQFVRTPTSITRIQEAK